MAHVTILTPTGRGAVATIRLTDPSVIEQPLSLWRAMNGRPLADLPIGRVCLGRWGIESPEEVVLCRTEPDVVEIHCHGGTAAVSRIVTDLEGRSCVRQSWQEAEQSRLCRKSQHSYGWQGQERSGWPCAGDVRAFPAVQTRPPEHSPTKPGWGLVESECREALTRATTLRTADILWQQCEGRLADVFTELETLPAKQAAERAAELLRWAEFGRHLTEPWQVVLCGRPNVGKSSLINALVGYGRSIVYDQPGTTRDVVTAETALGGWPVEFSDTAGLRTNADALESAGITLARTRLARADLRLLLLDTSRSATDDDHQLLAEWPDALIVAHKSDLPFAWGDELPPEALPVSSLTGAGLEALTSAITRRLVSDVPPPLTPVPVTARQVEFLERYEADSFA